MLKVHVPVLAAAAFLWSGSAEAARFYDVTLTGELVSELGYGPSDLNTGVDPNLATGNIVTLTARFNADRAFAQGGGFLAGLYGLPTSGDEFWRLDVGGLTWNSAHEMYDGFPIYVDDENFYADPSITFAGGKVTGVSGVMVPTWTDTVPVFRLSDFRIEPGEGLYGNTYGTQGFKGTWDYANSSAILTGVPEPTTWAIMIIGFGMTGAAIRSARRAARAAVRV
jgi:hypothetical protein